MDYEAGEPEYRYSKIEKLWYGGLPFGNIANLQPADTFQVNFEGKVNMELHLQNRPINIIKSFINF